MKERKFSQEVTDIKAKIKIIVTIWLLLVARTYAATSLHHYTFDGSAVIDLVGTANGTLWNGASVVSGRLNLDGINDYVQFSQHIIPTTGSFSVAFFAQELSPKADYTEIISQGYSGAPGFYVGYDPWHNFRIGDNLMSTGVPFPSDGLLHHYAVTAGVETCLYVDGSLIDTFGHIGMTTDGSDTRLGRQFGSIAEFFHGNVDELWIYNGVLTAGEVTALATVPEPATLLLLGLGGLALLRKRKT